MPSPKWSILPTQVASAGVSDNNGATVLHHAAEHSRGEIVELLIAHGASVAVRDESGRTPLHYAADAHNEEAVRVLLAHGADVNASTKGGDTPLSLARARRIFGFGNKTIDILVDAGAVATAEDSSAPAGR